MPGIAMESSNNYQESNEFFAYGTVLKRRLLFDRHDWALTYLRFFAYILLGGLIGLLHYNIGNDGGNVMGNLSFLYFNIMFLTFTSITITFLSYSHEMPALQKGNFHRYSLKSYYLAITLADIISQTIFCTVYVSIVYYLTSQPPQLSRYLMFLIASLLTSFIAQSIGLVAVAAMNAQNNVFLASAMSVILILFSGFSFISYHARPRFLQLFSYLSFGRYGFEGLALAIYSFGRTKLACYQTYCHLRNPEAILQELRISPDNYEFNIIGLVIILLILRILGYISLRMKLRSST